MKASQPGHEEDRPSGDNEEAACAYHATIVGHDRFSERAVVTRDGSMVEDEATEVMSADTDQRTARQTMPWWRYAAIDKNDSRHLTTMLASSTGKDLLAFQNGGAMLRTLLGEEDDWVW
jgi:hypothetical protein